MDEGDLAPDAPAGPAPSARERAHDRWRRVLTWPTFAAAILSIPLLIIETSDATQAWRGPAAVLDWVIWSVFAFELVVLVRSAPNRWEWIRRHPLDIAIVILTPPFLPAALQSMRVLRLLRVIRFVRVVMLARQVFSLDGIRYAAVVLLVTVLAGGVAFADAQPDEHLSDWDGIWWAITTVTTVGYGEPRVTTDLGRAIAIVLLVAGVGFVSLITGALAQRFTRTEAAEAATTDALLQELRALRARVEEIEAARSQPNPGRTA